MESTDSPLRTCAAALLAISLLILLSAACSRAPTPASPPIATQQPEFERAIDPPPISLDVHDATLRQVADALAKATSVQFDAGPFAYGPGRLDLTMHNAPLWDVLAAINHQMPIELGDARDLHCSGLRTSLWTRAKGFAIIPTYLWRAANPSDSARRGEQVLFFDYNVLPDPRIHDVFLYRNSLTHVVDDRGNVLQELPSTDAVPLNLWRSSHVFALPPTPGKTIVSARGELRLRLAFDFQSVEIHNAQDQPNHIMKLAGHTIAIEGFVARAGRIQFAMRLDNRPRPSPPSSPLETDPMIVVRLIDATGTDILPGGENPNESTGAMLSTSFTPPLSFRASCPSRFADATVRFELKNLPF